MSLLKLRQTNKLPNKQIAHYSICKKKNKKILSSPQSLGCFHLSIDSFLRAPPNISKGQARNVPVRRSLN